MGESDFLPVETYGYLALTGLELATLVDMAHSFNRKVGDGFEYDSHRRVEEKVRRAYWRWLEANPLS